MRTKPASVPATLLRAMGWTVVLVSVAACTEAKRRKDRAPAGASAPAAASAPATASTPAAASAPATPTAVAPAVAPAPAPAPGSATEPQRGAGAVPVRRGLDPAKATGRVRVSLSLPGPRRLGGFSFLARHDADRFHVAEPVPAAALQGYFCQANMAEPGLIRFNCAGLVNEDRGGVLATFEVAHAGAPPAAADFQVTEFEAVDDLARKIDGVRPVLAVEPIAP